MSAEADYAQLVRAALSERAARIEEPQLRQAAGHLLGRGKLFRPLLALATCEAITGVSSAAYAGVAAGVELLHTFTLIHDDLPCMDDAELRRGVRSVHIEYGEAAAVLAGDLLSSAAVEQVTHAGSGLAAEVRLAMVALLTEATARLIEGQMLDMAGEGAEPGLEELIRLHRLKTGALLGASCALGALLAGETDTTSYARIGELIGLAFQARDDLLSVSSTPAELGKPTGLDAASRKSTFPRVLGEAGARQFAEERVAEALKAIDALQLKQPQRLRAMALAAIDRQS